MVAVWVFQIVTLLTQNQERRYNAFGVHCDFSAGRVLYVWESVQVAMRESGAVMISFPEHEAQGSRNESVGTGRWYGAYVDNGAAVPKDQPMLEWS